RDHAMTFMRTDGRITHNTNNEQALVVVYEGSASVRSINDNFSTDRNPGNAQIIFHAVVALHKNSNRVPAVFRVELSGSRADSSFESVANHSRATANIAFLNGTGRCGIDGVQSVLGLYVETIDVVEP